MSPFAQVLQGRKSLRSMDKLKAQENLKTVESRRIKKPFAKVNSGEVYKQQSKKYQRSDKGIRASRYAKMKQEAKREELELLSRDEFYSWTIAIDDNFCQYYYSYSESNYDKKLAPVIERIDKSKGFIVGNIKWTIQKNKNRSNGREIVLIKNGREKVFPSARKAEMKLKLPKGVLSRALRTSGKYKELRVRSKEHNKF